MLKAAARIAFYSVIAAGWAFALAGLVVSLSCATVGVTNDCRQYGCGPGLECRTVADVARCFPEWEHWQDRRD